MRSMEIDRRRFLGLAALAGLAPTVLRAAPELSADGALSALVENQPLYLAARKAHGRYEAVVLDVHGRDRLVVPMPARGHSFALDPVRGRAVAFGRQPGFFAVAFQVD